MKPEEIKKIREEKNLSKADFAKAIGVTAMLLGRYEKGSCAIPEKVAEAALALGAAKAVQKTVEKKVEKAVKATAKKAAGKAAKAAVGVSVAKGVKKKVAPKAGTFTIESKMGGQITYDEIIKKVPKGADVYVKPEENKAYWVKGKKRGEVVLWE